MVFAPCPVPIYIEGCTGSNGLKLKISTTAVLSLDLSGQASVSLWTQTGRIHCENAAAVSVLIRASVGDGETETLLAEQTISLEGMLVADTLIDMSGEQPLACLILNQQPTRIRRKERRVQRDQQSQAEQQQTVAGLTWNLNVENNRICSRMGP